MTCQRLTALASSKRVGEWQTKRDHHRTYRQRQDLYSLCIGKQRMQAWTLRSLRQVAQTTSGFAHCQSRWQLRKTPDTTCQIRCTNN